MLKRCGHALGQRRSAGVAAACALLAGIGVGRPADAARPGVGAIQVFRPLTADPRENQFRMAWSHYREAWRYGTDITDSLSRGGFEERSGTRWDVAVGATLRFDPMRRVFRRGGPWRRYQIGLPAGVFARFDNGTKQLINADYQFGMSIDMLWSGAWHDSIGVTSFATPVVTSRLAVYHRSTHLGDEYLANGAFGDNQAGHPDADELFHRPPVKRVDLTYEAIRGIVSAEWAPGFVNGGRSTVRVYGGGELKWAIRPRHPTNFSSPIAQAGLEIRSAGNQDDPADGWLTRVINAPFRRPFFETEWVAAIDWKLARPYDFASCDNPDGTGEAWTSHLWTDCRHGREFAGYAGSWHGMVGLSLSPGAQRRSADGGRRLAPEIVLALEWYRGYSADGQFLDQRLRTRPLAYLLPGITVHF
jgi:hypothetical protein